MAAKLPPKGPAPKEALRIAAAFPPSQLQGPADEGPPSVEYSLLGAPLQADCGFVASVVVFRLFAARTAQKMSP